MAGDSRERYIAALERVKDLKEQHPLIHEAVLLVVAAKLGDEIQAFYRVPTSEASQAGIRSHAAHTAIDQVYAILKAPESRLKQFDAPPVKVAKGEDPEEKRKLYDKVAGRIRKVLGLDRVVG